MSTKQSRLQEIISQIPDTKEGASQLNALSKLFMDQRDFASAKTIFTHLIKEFPTFSLAHYNMAVVLQLEKQYKKAIKHLYTAHHLNPSNDQTLSSLIYAKKMSCDFTDLENLESLLDEHTTTNLLENKTPLENPYLSVLRSENQDRHFQIASSWASQAAKGIEKSTHTPYKKKRLRVAYISSDFGISKSSHLLIPLITQHNRSKFEVLGITIEKLEDNWFKDQLVTSFDHFLDLSKLVTDKAIEKVKESNIDILIDLNGHAYGNKMNLMAAKPAPIIVSFLGFPASTGGDYYDYVMSDSMCIPKKEFGLYSEKVAHLPYSYIPSFPGHPMPLFPPTRRDYRLPSDSFVFAHLGHPSTITPTLLKAWVKIIKMTPKALLWLYSNSPDTTSNLKRALEKSGLNLNAVKFTYEVSRAEHLARHQLADLILSPWNMSEPTGTLDAITMGIPVLVKKGASWATRIPQSIVHYLSIPNLISNNAHDYVNRAILLGRDTALYQNTKKSLAKNVATSPFIQSGAYIKNIESLYQKMWHRFERGMPPKHIAITKRVK